MLHQQQETSPWYPLRGYYTTQNGGSNNLGHPYNHLCHTYLPQTYNGNQIYPYGHFTYHTPQPPLYTCGPTNMLIGHARDLEAQEVDESLSDDEDVIGSDEGYQGKSHTVEVMAINTSDSDNLSEGETTVSVVDSQSDYQTPPTPLTPLTPLTPSPPVEAPLFSTRPLQRDASAERGPNKGKWKSRNENRRRSSSGNNGEMRANKMKRNSLACERCHFKKVRCSGPLGVTCSRCVQDGKSCFYDIPLPKEDENHVSSDENKKSQENVLSSSNSSSRDNLCDLNLVLSTEQTIDTFGNADSGHNSGDISPFGLYPHLQSMENIPKIGESSAMAQRRATSNENSMSPSTGSTDNDEVSTMASEADDEGVDEEDYLYDLDEDTLAYNFMYLDKAD
ncbi:uncharacterized protein L201_008045 [Kwoniella dendrophila CBS 6074]|uniref:Zn(2)-C6 fungal-type domain-containing protein n=1 Tax=Kwoniella dendrophila CBS 6074 TaxID=1295534 RepID=A0AAX4K8C8_9TREE